MKLKIFLCVLCIIVFCVFGLMVGIQADYTFNPAWSGVCKIIYCAIWYAVAFIPLSFIPLIIKRKYYKFTIAAIILPFALYAILPSTKSAIYQEQLKTYIDGQYPKILQKALAGDYKSIAMIGMYYYYGRGHAPVNYVEAATWFNKLGPSNDGSNYINQARGLLAEMYCLGIGVTQDYNLCVKWADLALWNDSTTILKYNHAQTYNEAQSWIKLADYYMIELKFDKAKQIYIKYMQDYPEYCQKRLRDIEDLKKQLNLH